MPAESARFWHEEALGGFDLLSAHYITHSFAPHSHEGYTFGILEQGVEAFRHQGSRLHASAEQIVLVHPDVIHTGYAPLEDGWTYRMYYLADGVLERVARELGLRNAPYFPDPVMNDPLLYRELAALHRDLEGPLSPLEREGRALAAFSRLLLRQARGVRPPPAAVDSGAVRVARDYLEAHYARGVTLEELARAAGLSPFHLSRRFHLEVGLPPHAYQTLLRVRQASRLLRAGLAPAQVALEVGFADQSHLTRVFRRHHGVTPALYARARTF
ncbi:AraC-like DNA-binding protein [Deinobacterium chartae]|uniref:AraC-like DNA-binding protein n=1 Tax=Deinobacterium chartae TaxID=521158 RepID=A0A841HYQ6_9DEIO|nr:AraC family transcriptional regulator [Deinobacterium chartae]MBB6098681.1 AraC-like DNA-binding protein [Deinobacterium chartae]